MPNLLTNPRLSHFSVEAGGIVALADLGTIAERTALMGTSSWVDILVVAPGIHLHQKSADLANAGGELPPTAALTTGYVFRVENQAMVGWLQSVGKPGNLVEVFVDENKGFSIFASGPLATVTYLLAPIFTIAAVIFLGIYNEWWTFGIIFVLIFARLVNVAVIKRRAKTGWKGASEPGVTGDLLILLSQDRWIRMRGMVDDLKAVTSGQWLEDMAAVESFACAGATLLVYVTAALSANASTLGNVILMALLFIEVGLLGLSNKFVLGIQLHGRIVKQVGQPKAYKRRLDLANELIEETGRRDWAIGLGMVPADSGTEKPTKVVL